MIDWHTHILPSMDDGSKDAEESTAMLKLCKDEGVGTVILTPHFYPHREDPERFIKRRARSFERLQTRMRELCADSDEVEWPELIAGAEVYYFNELAQMDEKDLRSLCIGGSDYMMVEPPAESWNADIYGALEALIYNRGIIPVLAHIDRYFPFIKDKSPIRELVGAGMLIQMNVDSLEGFFSRRKAMKWIDHGFVHILASDCHNISERPPNLHKGREILRGCFDKIVAEKLTSLAPEKKPLT